MMILMTGKTFIKGIFDNRPSELRILVTGIARLHTFRKEGESLGGPVLLFQ